MILSGERLPSIEAPRVVMRWLEDSDASNVYRIFSDPQVMQYWSSLPLSDPAQAEELVAGIQRLFVAHTLYEWGVARRSDDRVIGTFTLWHLDHHNRRAEVGFALARDCWRQGYMREALTAGLDFAFGPLDLTRLEADVDPRNEVSLRLLASLGFRREGLLRERWRVGGQTQDSVVLGLLRRDWNRHGTKKEAEQMASITVNVENQRNDRGQFIVVVYDSEASWLDEDAQAPFATFKQSVSQGGSIVISLAAGTYGFVVLHDENMNDEMDTSGPIPREGLAVSNDARVTLRGPKWKDAKFVATADAAMSVRLKYFL